MALRGRFWILGDLLALTSNCRNREERHRVAAFERTTKRVARVHKGDSTFISRGPRDIFEPLK